MIKDNLPGSVAHQLHALAQVVDEITSHGTKDGNAAQVGFERALTVILLQLGAEGLVLLQYVEHVAQHLQHYAIGGGARRGRAGIKTHAGHLTEQISGAELGDGMVVLQLDGSVDGDVSAHHIFLRSRMLAAAHQLALQNAEQATVLIFRVDVRARAGNKDIYLAIENVKRGRAVVAFAKQDLALLDDAFDHGALVQVEEGPRDALKHGQRQQFLRLHRMPGFHLLADHSLIGKSTSGARYHALAAGDTTGAAHGIVHVKGDGGAISLALPGDDEVVTQVGAGAHAAIAKNTGRMIHQNSERRIILSAIAFA